MGSTHSRPVSAAGQTVASVLTAEHTAHLELELGGPDGLDAAIRYGARSVSAAEADAAGFRLFDRDGRRQISAGLQLPFADGFAQLRCDDPPLNRKGDPAKYLNRSRSKQQPATFGDGPPTLATEGWKDGLRLHLATGETVQALAGVTGWPTLAPSVRTLVYDADAAINPHVWSQLLAAGAKRPGLRLALFSAETAGAKGGACEHFAKGGSWPIQTRTARELMAFIASQLPKNLRPDWILPTLRNLAAASYRLGGDDTAAEMITATAARQLGARVGHAREVVARIQRQRELEACKAAGVAPEGRDTRERCAALLKAIGRQWQHDETARDGWRQWTGTHWREVASNDAVLRVIEVFMDRNHWQDRELPTVRSLLAAFRRSVPPISGRPRQGLIPFRNGALNLESGKILPHDPSHGNTFCLPFDYNPTGRCDRIQAFLADRLGDAESVAMIRAFIRAAMLGERHKLFLEITGATDTGKSVIQSLLTAAIGSENVVAGKLETLEAGDQRFETARFRHARLALFSEAQRYSGSLETLKAMTGGDPIRAERKGSNRVESFVFRGMVAVIGNGAISPSDASGAVINRRRSVHMDLVIAPGSMRDLLEPDGHGGWTGELAAELPGFAAWCLAMAPDAAKAALSRSRPTLARAESELRALLETDALAQWADECLIWDPSAVGLDAARVGKANDRADRFLYAAYVQWLEGQSRHTRELSLRTFKNKLVGLLRDTLALPLPAGNPCSGSRSGPYNARHGSVIPSLRLRKIDDPADAAGVITHAVMARVPACDGSEPACDGCVMARTQSGNGCDGCDGSEQISAMGKKIQSVGGDGGLIFSSTDVCPPESITSVTSVPPQGFCHHASITDGGQSITSITATGEPLQTAPQPDPGFPIRVDGKPGWRQIARGSGNGSVLCRDPAGESRQISRKRITPEIAA